MCLHAVHSNELSTMNEFLYIHSLDFALIIYVTKIRQFHVSQFWHETGPISPFVVLALSTYVSVISPIVTTVVSVTW